MGHHEHRSTSPGATRRQPHLLRRAGAAVAAGGLASLLLTACNAAPPLHDALRLTVPDSGGTMASCLPLTTEYLAEMSPAFAGTVTDAGDDAVTLQVDRWYAGEGPERVVLSIPEGATSSLIGEIDFREGVTYLITASDGVVNLCGFSGEATSDLQAAFDAAF